MVQNFICQLVSAPFKFDIKEHYETHSKTIKSLVDLFLNLLQQSPQDTVIVYFTDGISFYEEDKQQRGVRKVISRISGMIKSERILFKLFMTSPKRTSYLLGDPMIAKRFEVVELPQHIEGSTQGFGLIDSV